MGYGGEGPTESAWVGVDSVSSEKETIYVVFRLWDPSEWWCDDGRETYEQIAESVLADVNGDVGCGRGRVGISHQKV